MSDLLAARMQMAMSLGFHIVFAVVGMAMPILMAIAESLHFRTKDPLYLELAKRWARGTAIIFAVGAVSGTVLSFELGLLWPTFMEHAGPIVGMPFSMEGFAFFLEAIFIGIYLYGWNRVSPRAHLASGVVVAMSGTASGVFVVAVNAWMNTPSGVRFEGGKVASVDLWRAFFSPAFATQAVHMVLAAVASVALVVLGIHAWRLRAEPTSRFHAAAARLALFVAVVAVPLQLFSGDRSAKQLAEHQPAKLAAMEALFTSQTDAPLALGGWPDVGRGELRYALEIPHGLSFLAKDDFHARVAGLDEVARADWPPIPVVHVAFQIMVGCGTAMLALVAWAAALYWKKRERLLESRAFLTAATLVAPLGLVAVEAGWTVTEVGRQPWIIRGFMRTSEAVTPMPGLVVPLVAFTALYLVLGVVVVVMLRQHVFAAPSDAEPRRAA